MSETRFQQKPMLQQLPHREESCSSDFHPEHGLLPVPPSGASDPSKISICSYDTSEDGGDHPVFGRLPASCHSSDDGLAFSMPPRTMSWTSNSELLESSSDSELGGQGQIINGIPSSQTSILQSHSTPSGCVSDSSFGCSLQDSKEVMKLKEKVKDLADQLQEANMKLDAKNVKIKELERKLHECQSKSSRPEENPFFSKVSSRTETAYPLPNKQAQSSSHFLVQNNKVMVPRNSSASSISATFHYRGSDTVVFNSPASVSTV